MSLFSRPKLPPAPRPPTPAQLAQPAPVSVDSTPKGAESYNMTGPQGLARKPKTAKISLLGGAS